MPNPLPPAERDNLRRLLARPRLSTAQIRDTWPNDGAEGESVHWLCDLVEALPHLLDALDSAERERDRLREALETVRALDDADCGDSGCLFALQRGGMRTNSGCQCIEIARPGVRQRLVALVKAARAALEDPR